MASNGGSNQACAACKYQRRKCSPECPLAPYFPPDQPKQFLNVHRLFGVCNVLRILRQVDPSKKIAAMKSIVYEADAWEKDPVHGCFGIIKMLQNQAEQLREELEVVRNQLLLFTQEAAFYNPQQQQTKEMHSQLSGSVSHPLSNPWMCQYLPYSQIGIEPERSIKPDLDPRLGFDIKLLEYEPKASYHMSN